MDGTIIHVAIEDWEKISLHCYFFLGLYDHFLGKLYFVTNQWMTDLVATNRRQKEVYYWVCPLFGDWLLLVSQVHTIMWSLPPIESVLKDYEDAFEHPSKHYVESLLFK